MTEKDLDIINDLLKRTDKLPEILHLRAAPIGYELTTEDKKLLLDTYQELDDILKEVAAFINVKFPGRQDYIQSWNDIDFDTKIGGMKVITTDREHTKSEWKKGIFDLKSLIKSLKNEVKLLAEKETISQSIKEEETKPTKRNYHLKEIIIGIIITVVGGIILNIIPSPKEIFGNKKASSESVFQKPYVIIENYKIKALNETARNLDTLLVKLKYQGSKITLNSNFKLVDYEFYEKQYFNLGDRNEFEPELELIEVNMPNPILDSLSKNSEIQLEIKRKLIFDGHKMAYFEENDKERIGNLRIAFNYEYQDKIVNDTLTSGIYIVK